MRSFYHTILLLSPCWQCLFVARSLRETSLLQGETSESALLGEGQRKQKIAYLIEMRVGIARGTTLARLKAQRALCGVCDLCPAGCEPFVMCDGYA